jgi:hypothetical protein
MRTFRLLYPWLVLTTVIVIASAWFVSHYWQGGVFAHLSRYELSLCSDMGELEIGLQCDSPGANEYVGFNAAGFQRSQHLASLGDGPEGLKRMGFSARNLVNAYGTRIVAVVLPHWFVLLPLSLWLLLLYSRGKYQITKRRRGFEVELGAK